jgi:hypothetical protein
MRTRLPRSKQPADRGPTQGVSAPQTLWPSVPIPRPGVKDPGFPHKGLGGR